MSPGKPDRKEQDATSPDGQVVETHAPVPMTEGQKVVKELGDETVEETLRKVAGRHDNDPLPDRF